jgi:hypothetical protein
MAAAMVQRSMVVVEDMELIDTTDLKVMVQLLAQAPSMGPAVMVD